MKLYFWDQKNVTFTNVTKKVIITSLGIIFILSIIMCLFILKHINDVNFISRETKAIILRERDEFTPEKLKAYVLELNIKYPYIVMAQAQVETGNFTSFVFRKNHNLFGMKEATKRPTTNKGTENNHAIYNNWRESVQDYAMFAAAYLNDVHSENEYFEYLRQNYAQDTNYVTVLKRIISKNNILTKKGN